MNKMRRKELERAVALIAEARSIIEAMQEEEQDCYDSIPESLQCSELGEKIGENADRLAEVASNIEEQERELEDIIYG